MDHHSHEMIRSSNYGKYNWRCTPSTKPEFSIQFTFCFRYKHSNWIHFRNSTAFAGFGPSSPAYSSAAVEVRQGAVSYEEIRETVVESVAGHLVDDEFRQMIEPILKNLHDFLSKQAVPTFTILFLNFEIVVDLMYVIVLESDYPRMVPAARSSLELLEKCEGGRGDGACCICMEDFGGQGVVKMPCSHIFHGGCIEEWLRASHYCPLCRYEMPMEE